MIKFYDTNALLALGEEAFTDDKMFVLSAVTLRELEHIKQSQHKSEEVKYRARVVTRLLDEHRGQHKYFIQSDTLEIDDASIGTSADWTICCDAYNFAWKGYQFALEDGFTIPDEDLIPSETPKKKVNLLFISDDISCKNIAADVFHLTVASVRSEEDSYTGYQEVSLSDKDMAYLYEHLEENHYNLLHNQYLIIKNPQNEVVDLLKWNGTTLHPLRKIDFKSKMFGSVKPYQGDVYQRCAVDSLLCNQVTMLKGPAGTGKSHLALGYLFYLLDKKIIDKIIVFCNTVATANAARLGFYPGDRNSKLLDSQIGTMLSSKLGDTYVVENMIRQGQLVLLPMADLRGYDTSHMNAGVYITEAQNTDIGLMKLALQRIGSDCVCVIDGDYNAQVDLLSYAGYHNGMHRASEVLRGEDFYGEVELQNIYRSRLAAIAEKM